MVSMPLVPQDIKMAYTRYFTVDSPNRREPRVQYVLGIHPILMTWPEEGNHTSHRGANNHTSEQPTHMIANETGQTIATMRATRSIVCAKYISTEAQRVIVASTKHLIARHPLQRLT